jgi:acetyl esterase
MNSSFPILLEPHPGYQTIAEKMREAGLELADPLTQPLDVARKKAEAFHLFLGRNPRPAVAIRDLDITGPHGTYRLRIYYPEETGPHPVTVYFHGGGYVLNNIDTHDALLRLLTQDSGTAICSLNYIKAPEACFPAQLNEAQHLLEWLSREGHSLNLDSSRIALSGDSSGAHLALTTALALRDRGQKNLRGLVLAYGMFESTFDTSSHRNFGCGYGLTSERMRWFWKNFLPLGQDRSAPLVSPLWANLAGLPKTLLLAAGLDCLRDDSLNLAKRLESADVPSQLTVYENLQHGFLLAHDWLPPARQAVSEIALTLKDWLRG